MSHWYQDEDRPAGAELAERSGFGDSGDGKEIGAGGLQARGGLVAP